MSVTMRLNKINGKNSKYSVIEKSYSTFRFGHTCSITLRVLINASFTQLSIRINDRTTLVKW